MTDTSETTDMIDRSDISDDVTDGIVNTSSMNQSLPYSSEFSMRANLEISWGVFIQRMKTITRYKGTLAFDIILPTIFALFPILMGQSVAGGEDAAAANFAVSAGSSQYILYMVIGANIFQIINGAINNFGFFLRKEQMQGTLESLYLTPVNQLYVLLGTGMYTIIRAIFNFFASLLFASLIFGVNPFTGNFGLAILFLVLGMIPVYGLAFGFGAIVLRFKEINALQQLVNWFLSMLMGIFFPISLFPKLLQYIAYLFPPTWHNNGVKAAIVDTSFIIRDIWYADLGIILIFAIVYPILGTIIYTRTDKQMRRTTGLGVF